MLAFAGDSTHRWWKFGRQETHKRFWRQTILWLAQRDKKQANSVFIELARRRTQAGRKLTFKTGLTDELGDIVNNAKLRATLTMPDGTTEVLPLVKYRRRNEGSN